MAFYIAWPDTGELTRRILIKHWTDIPNASFGITPTFDAGIPAWAKIKPVTGVLYWGNKQIGNDITHIFWVRYRQGTRPEDIGGDHVIEWNNRRYRIKNATNMEDANVFTMIETTDLGAISG